MASTSYSCLLSLYIQHSLTFAAVLVSSLQSAPDQNWDVSGGRGGEPNIRDPVPPEGNIDGSTQEGERGWSFP